jgi:hypothetical protein
MSDGHPVGECISTLLLKKDKYYVGDQPSGNLLLRVIIRESSLDNNASTSIIRMKLSELDQYMPMCKGNIKTFNNTYNFSYTHSTLKVKRWMTCWYTCLQRTRLLAMQISASWQRKMK